MKMKIINLAVDFAHASQHPQACYSNLLHFKSYLFTVWTYLKLLLTSVDISTYILYFNHNFIAWL